MENEKLVSVIVPIYNSEKYLDKCIQSILSQSYRTIELILIDDGSVDGSLNICQKYSVRDERVIVYAKSNSGVSDARNEGIRLAKGDFLSFVDSDDIIKKNMISSMVPEFLDENIDLVMCNYEIDYSGKIIKKLPRFSGGKHTSDSLLESLIDDGTMTGVLLGSVCFCLYKRSIITDNAILFDTEVIDNEDGLFNMNYLRYVNSLLFLSDKYLYVYRQEVKTKVYTSENVMYRYDFINKKFYEFIEKSNIINYEKQLNARYVSIALWDIMALSNKLNIDPPKIIIENIRKICSKSETQKGIKYVNPKKLSIYKRVYYHLIRKRRVIALFILTRYILPIMASLFKR